MGNSEWLLNYCRDAMRENSQPTIAEKARMYGEAKRSVFDEIRYYKTFMYPNKKHSHKRISRGIVNARLKLKEMKRVMHTSNNPIDASHFKQILVP